MPESMRKYWRTVDIDQEMFRCHTPAGGRSIEVLAKCPPAELWSHHIDHVARYSTERGTHPIRHDDLQGAISISTTLFAHDEANFRGFSRIWRVLLLLYFVVGLLLIFALANLSSTTAAALTAALLALLTFPVIRLIIGGIRSLPIRWRPPLVARRGP